MDSGARAGSLPGAPPASNADSVAADAVAAPGGAAAHPAKARHAVTAMIRAAPVEILFTGEV